MTTHKRTQSSAKLTNWAAIHALDVRAKEIMAAAEQGGVRMTREQAYTRAMDEREGR